MDIKEAQKSLNKEVHYENCAYGIDGVFTLSAIVVRRKNGTFVYSAELESNKENSVFYDDITKIELKGQKNDK